MKLLIVTHVTHKIENNVLWAYGPYVRELRLWQKYTDELIIVAPLERDSVTPIDLPYSNGAIDFREVPSFNILNLRQVILTMLNLPKIILSVWAASKDCDHIHLRCPGNMGLVGSIVQIFFRNKPKTAKYAGNWDWSSKQPLTYRIQQLILRNTLISKNMKVLVYGDWNETKNILPFFTASYSNKDIIPTELRDISPRRTVNLIFVGRLHSGKQPSKCVDVVNILIRRGIKCRLDFYGSGPELDSLSQRVSELGLDEEIRIHGNVDSIRLIEAYKKAHFLVFLSKSEGWPKAVAESMFWGCVPLTTPVSCVEEMVGYGDRGDIISLGAPEVASRIVHYINSSKEYIDKAGRAMTWSRQYTLEKFEKEIQKLLS